MAPQPIAATLTLTTPTGQPMPSIWSYHPTDPLAIRLRLHSHHRPVTWVLARDLLTAGLHSHTPVGDGDIRLWSTPTHTNPTRLQIDLTSPDGHAHLSTTWQAATAFLRHTHTTVPPPTETTLLTHQIETALHRLLPTDHTTDDTP